MFCGNCGSPIDATDHFCAGCGAKLDGVTGAVVSDAQEQTVSLANQEAPAMDQITPTMSQIMPTVAQDMPVANQEMPAANQDVPAGNAMDDVEKTVMFSGNAPTNPSPEMQQPANNPYMPNQDAGMQNTYMPEQNMYNQGMPNQSAPNAAINQYLANAATGSQGAPKKKKKTGLFIGLGAGAAVLAAGAITFFALGGVDRVKANRPLKLASQYMDEMDYEMAIASYEEAIEIAPKLPDGYIGLADVYVAMEDYQDAIDTLQNGLDQTGGSKKIENRLDEILDEHRGFDGTVYIVDTDLDPDNNSAFEGVTVTVDGPEKKTCTTEADGHYVLEGIEAGTYTVSFEKPGYITYETDMELGDEVHRTNIYLEPEGYATLYGSVTIADEDTNYGNNSPLAGASVKIKKCTGSSSFEASASTDDTGMYTFDGLVMGVYELTIENSGYQTVTEYVTIYEGMSVCYNVMIEAIDEQYAGTGTASGRIYDAVTGAGVGGLTLYVRKGVNTYDGDVIATITTDEDGYYMTDELMSGNYTIEVVDERDVEEPFLGCFINVKILGGMDIANQDGTVSTTMLSGQVRIVMSWGSTPSDLDSHLDVVLDNGISGHIFYGAKTLMADGYVFSQFEDYYYAPGDYDVTYGVYDYDRGDVIAELDLDDTDCYGPETTTIYNPQDGTYTFGVFDYSRNSHWDLAESGATVQVYMNNSATPQYVFYVPYEYGLYWEVFRYDAKTQILTPINTMLDDYNYGY